MIKITNHMLVCSKGVISSISHWVILYIYHILIPLYKIWPISLDDRSFIFWRIEIKIDGQCSHLITVRWKQNMDTVYRIFQWQNGCFNKNLKKIMHTRGNKVLFISLKTIIPIYSTLNKYYLYHLKWRGFEKGG